MFARRNRKKRLNTLVPSWSFGGVLFFVVVLGAVYVGMCHSCDKLGREIKVLELERIDLNKKHVSAEFRWASLKSPQGLEAALAAHQIQMDWPRQNQIVWMDGGVRRQAPPAPQGVGRVAWRGR
jgi:hypothetical protein